MVYRKLLLEHPLKYEKGLTRNKTSRVNSFVPLFLLFLNHTLVQISMVLYFEVDIFISNSDMVLKEEIHWNALQNCQKGAITQEIAT